MYAIDIARFGPFGPLKFHCQLKQTVAFEVIYAIAWIVRCACSYLDLRGCVFDLYRLSARCYYLRALSLPLAGQPVRLAGVD